MSNLNCEALVYVGDASTAILFVECYLTDVYLS